MGLSLDVVLSRLQGELQKSRKTGAELNSLTGTMNESHDHLDNSERDVYFVVCENSRSIVHHLIVDKGGVNSYADIARVDHHHHSFPSLLHFHLFPFSPSPKNMPRVNSNANNATNAPDFLPSYEAAVGVVDSSRLPSYKRSYAARFHPYRRPTFQTVDEGDRFLVSMTFFTYLFCTNPPPQRTLFLMTSTFC